MNDSHDVRRPWPPDLDRGIHLTTIDEVDTLWAEIPGPFTAALKFRVGRADETLASAGVTHVAEHLALDRFEGRTDFDPNGQVEELFTVFFASGRRELVGDFLTLLAQTLGDPPRGQLATVRQIVRQESDRPLALDHMMRTLRFGASTHGLPGLPQLGLARLTADDIGRWARSWFTAANAVLVLSGPPPDGLRLPLPAGPWRPPPTSRPIAQLTMPLARDWPFPVVGLSAMVTTKHPIAVPVGILRERLRRALRTEKGLIYDIEETLAPLDAETAHLSMTAETTMDRAASVRDGIMVELDELVRAGPSAEELAVGVARAQETLDHPVDQGDLDYWATMRLLGAQAKTKALSLSERDALTAADCQAVYRKIRESAIMALPEGISAPSDFASDDGSFGDVITGKLYKPTLRWLPFIEKRPLVVGEEGFAVIDRGGQFVVRYDDCVAWEIHSDGSRVGWRSDGGYLEFHPRAVSGGRDAIADLDRRIPPALHVPVDCADEATRQHSS
jgi:hypothetical protein